MILALPEVVVEDGDIEHGGGEDAALFAVGDLTQSEQQDQSELERFDTRLFYDHLQAVLEL